MGRIRLAVVGCGSVAGGHLNAARTLAEDLEISLLVDRERGRAEELAGRFGVSGVAEDAGEVPGKADAALLALPHHLHAPVAVDLLKQGVHVLVEKPMAMTATECDAMVSAAEETGAVLSVGHARRWFQSSRYIKAMLDGGCLGPIEHFDLREGSVYAWPVASDFRFRPEAGGGVLADAGAHALDILLWWLGPAKSFEYYDDAQGGVEADCRIELTLESGAVGTVELSWTRDLRNTVVIEGAKGRLEVESRFDSEIRWSVPGWDVPLKGRVRPEGLERETVADLFRWQLQDFAEAIREGREPFITGRSSRAVVELIEACHADRRPLELPWVI